MPALQKEPGSQFFVRQRRCHFGRGGDLGGVAGSKDLFLHGLQELQCPFHGPMRREQRIDPEGEDLGLEPAFLYFLQVELGRAPGK
jgi:hypothetical protein